MEIGMGSCAIGQGSFWKNILKRLREARALLPFIQAHLYQRIRESLPSMGAKNAYVREV
jgi:hypothetical protein